MVKARITRDKNKIKNIYVSGHAESGPYGDDLVCAGVSAVMFGALNALDQFHSQDVKLTVLDNEIIIQVLKSSQALTQLLDYLIIQLETIEHQYSKYLKIIHTEV